MYILNDNILSIVFRLKWNHRVEKAPQINTHLLGFLPAGN